MTQSLIDRILAAVLSLFPQFRYQGLGLPYVRPGATKIPRLPQMHGRLKAASLRSSAAWLRLLRLPYKSHRGSPFALSAALKPAAVRC